MYSPQILIQDSITSFVKFFNTTIFNKDKWKKFFSSKTNIAFLIAFIISLMIFQPITLTNPEYYVKNITTYKDANNVVQSVYKSSSFKTNETWIFNFLNGDTSLFQLVSSYFGYTNVNVPYRCLQLSLGLMIIPVVRNKTLNILGSISQTSQEFYLKNNYYINTAILLGLFGYLFYNYELITNFQIWELLRNIFDSIVTPVDNALQFIEKILLYIFSLFHPEVFLYKEPDLLDKYQKFTWLNISASTTKTFVFMGGIIAPLSIIAASEISPEKILFKETDWYKSTINGLQTAGKFFFTFGSINVIILAFNKLMVDLYAFTVHDFLNIMPSIKYFDTNLPDIKEDALKYINSNQPSTIFLNLLEKIAGQFTVLDRAKEIRSNFIVWFDSSIDTISKMAATAYSYFTVAFNSVSNFFESKLPANMIKTLAILMGSIMLFVCLVILLKNLSKTPILEYKHFLNNLSYENLLFVNIEYSINLIYLFYLEIQGDFLLDEMMDILMKNNDLIINKLIYKRESDEEYVFHISHVSYPVYLYNKNRTRFKNTKPDPSTNLSNIQKNDLHENTRHFINILQEFPVINNVYKKFNQTDLLEQHILTLNMIVEDLINKTIDRELITYIKTKLNKELFLNVTQDDTENSIISNFLDNITDKMIF